MNEIELRVRIAGLESEVIGLRRTLAVCEHRLVNASLMHDLNLRDLTYGIVNHKTGLKNIEEKSGKMAAAYVPLIEMFKLDIASKERALETAIQRWQTDEETLKFDIETARQDIARTEDLLGKLKQIATTSEG